MLRFLAEENSHAEAMSLLTALAVFAAATIGAKKRRLVDPVIHAGKASGPRTDGSPPCLNYNCTQGWLTGVPINHWESEVVLTYQMQ